MIHDQNVKYATLVSPTQSASTNVSTANLDTLGADYAAIVIDLSAELNTNGTGPTISLLESDDTVATNFATFDANFERADEDVTSAKTIVYKVDTRARKRYLRISVTPETSTNDPINLAVTGITSRLAEAPASTSDMGADVVVIG